jgi:23S rRNA (cytidine1920-2'-O)/16S rRNA (cytidine1409-2'-O)-methyltransferase
VAPALAALTKRGADLIVLVKPQFEVGKDLVGRGVVRDAALRQTAVDKVKLCFGATGLDTVEATESPVTGERGNQEYLLWARKP